MTTKNRRGNLFTPKKDIVVSTNKTIYLGGTIHSKNNWQKDVVNHFRDQGYDVYNPVKRWGKDIVQAELDKFIEWQLDALEKADIIVLNIDEHSRSFTRLFEFGLYANLPSKKMTVYCSPKSPIFTHVRVTCKKYNVEFYGRTVLNESKDK